MSQETVSAGSGISDKLRRQFLRVARKVAEGFEGEIHLTITHGGIRSIRWVRVEQGDSIQEDME